MKSIATIGLVALACLTASGPAGAKPAGTPRPLFTCQADGKTISVTAIGTSLVYRYGTAAKPEMAIVGDATKRNVLYWQGRYAGIENQLRFTNGGYSYIVYAMEGNAMTKTKPVAGLVVKQGTKTISSKTCARYAEFDIGFDYASLPQDSETWTAM